MMKTSQKSKMPNEKCKIHRRSSSSGLRALLRIGIASLVVPSARAARSVRINGNSQ